MCYLPGFPAVSLEELLCRGMRRIQAGAQVGTGLWVRVRVSERCCRRVRVSEQCCRLISPHGLPLAGWQLSTSQRGGGSEQQAGINVISCE